MMAERSRMNCCLRMERASKRERIQEGVHRSGDDQALWDAYVEELLKAKAKCDELWKEKTEEERRTSLLTDSGASAAMAGSSFENSEEFGFGEITSIDKERWRTVGPKLRCEKLIPKVDANVEADAESSKSPTATQQQHSRNCNA